MFFALASFTFFENVNFSGSNVRWLSCKFHIQLHCGKIAFGTKLIDIH